LELAFNKGASRQWVATVVHQAGRRAGEILEDLALRDRIVQASADEIFAGKKPILTVVEPVSLALVDAVRSDTRRGKDWEAIFARYPNLQRVAADCGTGLLAGIKARELEHQPDPFHALHELYASVKRLEGLAYQAIEREYDTLKRLERARCKGDDLRPTTQQHRHACRKAREAIRHYDLAAWLARELHQALEVPDRITEDHLAQACATIHTAVELLGELGVPRLRRIQTYFEPHKILSFLRWAMAHPGQPIMRGSSCVEAVNSFLRTDQTVKKHLDQEYLNLLRWFYNTHPFSTGLRKGRSPLELLSVKIPYRSWLDPLID